MITRRSLLMLSPAALVAGSAPVRAQVAPMLASNSTYPDLGWPPGDQFVWTGAACTVYPSLYPNSTVTFAQWVVAWTPGTQGASPVIIRLVSADTGPSNIQEIARFTRTDLDGRGDSPDRDLQDITDQMQQLWAHCLATGTPYKHIGHQTASDGTDRPAIYQSRVELYVTTPV